jgi:hypothetical protein
MGFLLLCSFTAFRGCPLFRVVSGVAKSSLKVPECVAHTPGSFRIRVAWRRLAGGDFVEGVQMGNPDFLMGLLSGPGGNDPLRVSPDPRTAPPGGGRPTRFAGRRDLMGPGGFGS